ncbi:hypothetical protein EB796_007584 [Bugula neritina]|uniref:Uncharacterized protein n=1 Tax=Bugula neritina TaxID=10212 RepID=A0A7J7K7E8_BUGNE|nr:hypothetical protein EB796_007584 [Bugula neritina]
MRFFGNFIISGNPNIPLNDGPPTYTSPNNLRFINVYWPKYETGSHKYIQLGTRPLVSHDYRQARVALWTDHISGLHQPGETGVNSSQDLLDIIDSSTAGAHLPQPPTPPVIPPYHEKTTITQATKTKTTKARILQSDVDVITQQPITEVITKVVEVIRYKNKTVYFTESNSAPSSADEGIQMTLTLALTVGIGSAFLFLNLIIIIGICCQRSRVRAELAAVKKVQQQTSLTNTPLLTTETEHSTKSMRKGDAVKMLESHLYEKAMQHIDKQASSDKIVRPNADRRIPSEVNILEEGQSKGICDTMSSSRTKINYDTDNDTTDNEIIRGVPQGPAKPPVNMEPDIYA